MRRGELLLGCLGLAFPASSSRRGLGASAWSSRQAPLAGVLSPWPGKLLLPGPRLLGSNTWSPFGPRRGRRGSWRSPGEPCRRALLLSVHKFGVLRYPYFSTPTVPDRVKLQLHAPLYVLSQFDVH